MLLVPGKPGGTAKQSVSSLQQGMKRSFYLIQEKDEERLR